MHLELDNNPIGDGGLKFLPTVLVELSLRNTRITDAGIGHLKRMKKLRQLHIQGTKVTDAGVEKLKQALPGCSVER